VFVYELNHTLHTLVQTNGKNKEKEKKSMRKKVNRKIFLSHSSCLVAESFQTWLDNY